MLSESLAHMLEVLLGQLLWLVNIQGLGFVVTKIKLCESARG